MELFFQRCCGRDEGTACLLVLSCAFVMFQGQMPVKETPLLLLTFRTPQIKICFEWDELCNLCVMKEVE